MRTGLHVHLLHRHVQDTGIIAEEGNLPHPQYLRCGMLMMWADLNGLHPNITKFAKGAEQKRHRLSAEDMWESTERAFWGYG